MFLCQLFVTDVGGRSLVVLVLAVVDVAGAGAGAGVGADAGADACAGVVRRCHTVIPEEAAEGARRDMMHVQCIRDRYLRCVNHL